MEEILKTLPIIMTKDMPKLKYVKNKPTLNVHIGQRKLFLTVVQFLVDYTKDYKEFTCVYVGAGGGVNTYIIAAMFPQAHFYLYDTLDQPECPFEEENCPENITYNKRYFTDEDAQKWKDEMEKSQNLFFISDIRTMKNGLALEENDMKMQAKWVEIIDPVKAHLKFRLPFPDKKYLNNKYSYFNGVIYLQPWAPIHSTECRIVPIKQNGKYQYINYNLVQHEQQMFYFNMNIRSIKKYPNLYGNKQITLDSSNELLCDYDCYLEIYILLRYLSTDGNLDLDQAIKFSNMISYLLEKRSLSNERLQLFYKNFPYLFNKESFYDEMNNIIKPVEYIQVKEPIQMILNRQKFIREKITYLKENKMM